jgi:hypothetical protein
MPPRRIPARIHGNYVANDRTLHDLDNLFNKRELFFDGMSAANETHAHFRKVLFVSGQQRASGSLKERNLFFRFHLSCRI